MYILVTLADVVQIEPTEFHKPSVRAIEDWINKKYADKVLHKVGLCVGFHSLISASEGLIGHGNGIVNVNVDFRMVVFRPFKGEILQGTISQSHMQEGIYLEMDFFNELQVPPSVLPDPTEYREENGRGVFCWKSENPEAENGLGYDEYYFDSAERSLCRVEQEQWHDLSPQMQQQARAQTKMQDGDEDEDMQAEAKCPYKIHASMMLSGTGPKIWWIGEMIEEGASGEQT